MKSILCALPFLLLPLGTLAQESPLPIIDMHLHARDAPDPARELPPRLCLPVTAYGVSDPQCDEPLVAPATDEEMVVRTAEILGRGNVYGVISGRALETVLRFREAAPDRLIPAYELDLDGGLSPEELLRHFEAGDYQVLGEIAIQYEGIAPDDERMEPYWALAEELDIPVALHMGEGYPGAPYLGDPSYRVRFGSPLLLEEVLVRHPSLRLSVMHYGSPLVDEMIALMFTYPNVYVDIGSNVWHYPQEYFSSHLKQLVDAGFGKRILFGSDQLLWPELIEISINVIQEAPFLSEEQKRDILYNNAARFLRLSEEEIARHHGR